MRRWLKVLLGVLAALVVLLILNAVVLDHQTKSASVTVDGAKILSLPGGDLQVLDSGLVDSIFRARDSKAPRHHNRRRSCSCTATRARSTGGTG